MFAPGERSALTEIEGKQSLRTVVLASAPATAEAVFGFWVPRSNERADVAVIGNTLDGFEIKTHRDNLRRLPRQAEAYTRVFDRCHAGVARRPLELTVAPLPAGRGVHVIDEGPGFVLIRAAGVNGDVDPEILVRLLWRDEAYGALRDFGAQPDPAAGRVRLWEHLLGLLDVDGLKQTVRGALLSRDPATARMPSRRFALT